MSRAVARALGISLLLAALYSLIARLGLLFALPPGYASPIWPPAGLSLGALLVFGPRAWPGVLVGSWIANALRPEGPILDQVPVLVAIGSTLQALLGRSLVIRFCGKDAGLDSPGNVLRFVGATVASCVVSPTIGVLTLALSARLALTEVPVSWLTWWLGDCIGAVTFAPLVLLAVGRPREVWRPRLVTAGTPLLGGFILCLLLYLYVNGNEDLQVRNDLERLTDQAAEGVREQIESHALVLHALRGALRSRPPDPAVFSRQGAEVLQRLPGLRVIEWAQQVSGPELPAAQVEIGRALGHSFQITERDAAGQLRPVTARARYWPVVLAEPIAGNSRAVGFDLASEPVRADAVARAAASGEVVCSRQVRLVQADRNAVLLLLADSPRGSVHGLLLLVVEVDRLLRPLLPAERVGVRWLVRDLDAPLEPCLRGEDRDLAPALRVLGTRTTALAPAGVFCRRTVVVGDRRWEIIARRGRMSMLTDRGRLSWVVLAGALLASACGGSLLLMVTGRTRVVEELVRQRTVELVAARDEAVRADRAKSEFLAAMSHEIRTPLNGVIGMADLMAAGSLSPEQAGQAETIRSSGQTLLAVLNDILDWAKIEAGRLDVERLPVDAKAVAADTLALYHSKIQEQGVAMALDWPDATPRWVLADPMRLRQVLLNLVSNAVKFAPGGSVTIAAAPDGDRLAVSVRDTGIGMDEAQRARLFQPFTQGDASTTRRFGGTGLGLAITARLLAAMEGTIEAASTPGAGSTFTITLPLATAPAAVEPAPPVPPAVAAPDRPWRVLVAEDNAVNRRVAQGLLRRLGAQAECVNDGAQAVEATARTAYDLVLLDLHMPVLDGLAAARAIRAREAAGGGPRSRLVALTANAYSSDREACEAAGMDGFVAKPVTLNALRTVLQGLPMSAADPEREARI